MWTAERHRDHSAIAPYRGAPVLVVGAAGFIGRWVARLLTAAGAKLSLVVRARAVAEPTFARYDVRGRVIELDLGDVTRVGDVTRSVRPAVTFSLAGYGIDAAERDADAAYRINALLVKALSEALADARDGAWAGNHLVHVGTALEYGASASDVGEDSVPGPTTLYGRSKLEGTRSLAASCAARGLRGLTARLFTVYGPGEHPGRLLPSLLGAARTGAPVALTSGTQRRDFTYVEDAAEGLLRLGLAPAPPGYIVNLATGRLMDVRAFAETAAKLLRIPQDLLKFGALPTRPEEMQHGEVRLDRLRSLVAWAPPTGVDEGILKTMVHEANHCRGGQRDASRF